MSKLLERLINPASDKVQPDLKPEFILPDFDEEAFEAEFKTPEDQETPGTSKRVIVGLAAMAMAAGGVGFEAGQPDDELHISADQITEDLNSGDRTTEPVIIEQGSELVIPKEKPSDAPISVVNPIRLGDESYGAVVFGEDGKVKVMEIPPASDAYLKPVETDTKVKSREIVYPVSVVYTEVPTKAGKTERVYSAVAGDHSGNAADAVKIDTKHATPEQKRLLADDDLAELTKGAFGLAFQERVGYLDIAR